MDWMEMMNEEEKRKYVKGRKLGEGTYAVVYLGHMRTDPSTLVAIKKIKVQKEYNEGIAPDAIREIKFLQELFHPNIISLLAVFTSKDQNLNLVLEYLPLGDLEMVIRDTSGVPYGAADVKAWMGMLGRAVWWCHANWVLHRDIKPNNLLIGGDGELKLADFGLARDFADPFRPMTSNVITRWYRPPELLFGGRHYSGAVDIWSVGCVFAELVNRVPYMAGTTELHQIALICQAVGTPTDDVWPGVTGLPGYIIPDSSGQVVDEAANGRGGRGAQKQKQQPAVIPVRGRDHYEAMFGTVGPDGVDLLMGMLTLDPRKRVSAQAMLEHAWWRADPRPTPKEDLPRKSAAGGGQQAAQDQLAADLKRRPGMLDDDRTKKVARKLDFGGVGGGGD